MSILSPGNSTYLRSITPIESIDKHQFRTQLTKLKEHDLARFIETKADSSITISSFRISIRRDPDSLNSIRKELRNRMLMYLSGKMLLRDSGDLTYLPTLVIRLNHRVSGERPSDTSESRRDSASPLSSTKRHRHVNEKSGKSLCFSVSLVPRRFVENGERKGKS